LGGEVWGQGILLKGSVGGCAGRVRRWVGLGLVWGFGLGLDWYGGVAFFFSFSRRFGSRQETPVD
jgi:hypothetical protein